MRFTDSAIENIDKAKAELIKGRGRRGQGIRIENDIFGKACVYRDEHYLFEVSEMWAVVKELNEMIEIIKDTVGIYEEV